MCKVLEIVNRINIDVLDFDVIAAPYFARQSVGEVNLMDLFGIHPAPAVVRAGSRFHHDVAQGDFQGGSCLSSLKELVEKLLDKIVLRQKSSYIAKLDKSIACLSKRIRKAALAISSAELRALVDGFEVQAQFSGAMIRDELRTILGMGKHGAFDPKQLEEDHRGIRHGYFGFAFNRASVLSASWKSDTCIGASQLHYSIMGSD